MTSLTATPDITSITVSWQPPAVGEGGRLVSEYQLCYKPVQSTYTPNCVTLSGKDKTEFRVQKLQISLSYSITVRASIGDLDGQDLAEIEKETSAISKSLHHM